MPYPWQLPGPANLTLPLPPVILLGLFTPGYMHQALPGTSNQPVYQTAIGQGSLNNWSPG
jgi:hypothetical protein